MGGLSTLVVEEGGGISQALNPLLGGPLMLAGKPVTADGMLEAVRERQPAIVLAEVSHDSAALLKAVEGVMGDCPTPVLLLVRSVEDRPLAVQLLAAGALDVLVLPERPDGVFLTQLARQVALLAKVKVVRHPRGRRRRTSTSRFAAVRPPFCVVAIAASLGGPRALATLLAGLPRDFRAPVLICQHITPGFSSELAKWLAVETGHRVTEAVDGQVLVMGEFTVAPAHMHLVVEPRGAVRLDDGPPVGGFKPSCDVLLSSVGAVFGSKSIGVVLTGMGRDGAKGLKEINQRGGRTIAQDEKSCVVFGMPREAIALGAADKVLPLDAVADQLRRWVE